MSLLDLLKQDTSEEKRAAFPTYRRLLHKAHNTGEMTLTDKRQFAEAVDVLGYGPEKLAEDALVLMRERAMLERSANLEATRIVKEQAAAEVDAAAKELEAVKERLAQANQKAGLASVAYAQCQAARRGLIEVREKHAELLNLEGK